MSDALETIEHKLAKLRGDPDTVLLETRRASALQPFIRNQTVPVARLSSDVMRRIFLIAQNNELDWVRRLNGPSKVPVELAISHTSRHWREIALAMPILWSCIVSRQGYDSKKAEYLRVETYLARSRTYPLDIDVRIADISLSFLLC
jgi:hypothetical protein